MTRSRDASAGLARSMRSDSKGEKARRNEMSNITTVAGTCFRTSRAACTPIVFVVDDDVSVRESLELLIQIVRLAGRDIRVGAGVSGSAPALGSELPGPRRGPAGLQRSGSSEAHGCRSVGHAGHLHHRLRRRSHERPGHEGWSNRVPDQAVPRRCAVGRRSGCPRAESPCRGARSEHEGAS